MNHSKQRLISRHPLTALVVIGSTVLGLLAACSSDNSAPSDQPPVITLGGSGGTGGTGGSSSGTAGKGSGGANTSAQAGANSEAGESNSSAGAGGEEAGTGGSAGAPDETVACPTTDLGFYNQASTSQKSPFDNDARLGPHATLPALPGS
jgi:hypothetical protein